MTSSEAASVSTAVAAPIAVPHAREVTVFTPYFGARTPERQAELDLCLAMNLRCSAISRLVLLIDDGHMPPMAHPKIVVRRVSTRPTYLNWVDLSNELVSGGISILANTDIYFDESVAHVHDTLSTPQRLLALSRYEKVGAALQPHRTPRWSQDVWGLRGGEPLVPSLRKALDIPMGVPRCDNKIAYLFAVHGWTVHNPMSFICSVHVHETQQRNYDKKSDLTVMGGVAYVEPASAVDSPSMLEFDVWARNVHQIKGVKVNRSLDDWLSEAATTADAAPPDENTIAIHRNVPATAVCSPVADPQQIGMALASGDRAFNVLGRFTVYRHDGRHMAIDGLSPAHAQWLVTSRPQGGSTALTAEMLLPAFVPPTVDTAPIRIGRRPRDRSDCDFWQYPAATERQALENHLAIVRGSNVEHEASRVHTYLGLPWATYIDKTNLPDRIVRLIGLRLGGMRHLAQELGYELCVHTVCQHIHWRRLAETFHQIGVTDLHLSHAETHLDPATEGCGLQLHSWPLFAPNVEDPERQAGLIIGKPLHLKRYLASFIGAHMPHYRSDGRLQILEAARASGRDDVLVDLGNEWHFNKVVYEEQAQHKQLTQFETDAHDAAARRYNEVLSDSVFSLCPEGAGPNTLRLWESLAVGAIPVVLAEGWLPPGLPGSENVLAGCCLFVQKQSIATLFESLEAIPRDQVERMQQAALDLYPKMRSRTCFGILNTKQAMASAA